MLDQPVADAIIFGIPCYSPETVAAQLGLKKNTLAIWRVQKKGPAYRKVGNNIFYPVDEARAWFESTLGKTI